MIMGWCDVVTVGGLRYAEVRVRWGLDRVDVTGESLEEMARTVSWRK